MDCPEPWAEAERSDKISEEFRQEKIESEYSSEGRKKLLGSGRILKEEPRGFEFYCAYIPLVAGVRIPTWVWD